MATRPAAVLADLLMAVMDSVATWRRAAGDRGLGLAWRDAVTRRMIASAGYLPYEALVGEVAAELGLADAPGALWAAWPQMEPHPDAAALSGIAVPLGFVSNTSTRLAGVAADRSGLRPALVLAAEEAGRYKPHPAVYALACRRLGTRPSETLFVAGAPYDAAGAHAAGLQTALVRRRPDLPGTDGPWVTVDSLTELSGMLE